MYVYIYIYIYIYLYAYRTLTNELCTNIYKCQNRYRISIIISYKIKSSTSIYHLLSLLIYCLTLIASIPRVFHVETTCRRPFVPRFNVEYWWCACRVEPQHKNKLKSYPILSFTKNDMLSKLIARFHSALNKKGKSEISKIIT